MKAVLDTNIFVSSFFGGNPRRIIDLWKVGEIEICMSEEVLEEYLRVLVRFQLEAEALDDLLQVFKAGENICFVRVQERLEVIKEDPGDNKFLECAVSSGADFIISGDHHLLELGEFRGTRIVTPATFLQACEKGAGGN